ARAASSQDERAERPLCPEQRDHKRCTKPRFKHGVAQRFARTLGKVRYLQWLPLGYRLSEPRLSQRNVELSEPCDHLFIKPRGFPKLELAGPLKVVENRASVSAGEVDRAVDYGLQHHL